MHSGDFFVCFCQSWSLKRHGSLEEGRHGAAVEGGVTGTGRHLAGLGWAGLSLAGLGKFGILLGTLCVLLQQIIYLNYFLTESQWACV